MRHLKKNKILAHRSTCIANIPYFKPALPAAPEAQIEVAVADLVRRKAAKPRTQQTLLNTLHASFRKELTEEQPSGPFSALCNRGIVTVDSTKVSYHLPVTPPG